MTERQFAIDVVRRLREAGFEAYWAGGCVRDEVLGLVPADYDVATNARPEQVQHLFRKTVAVGAAFGVIEVLGPRPLTIEIATFRSDGAYTDGRRPDSVVFCSAEEDARRRDFTINGMFFDPLENRLLDYVGGQADLAAKVLRAIGNPIDRFTEDKLRMLRGVRMATRFDLNVDPDTADAIRMMAGEIIVVSHERIGDELHKMLVHPRRARGLWLMDELHLIPPILPELEEMKGLAQGPPAAPTGDLWEHVLKVMELLEGPTWPEANPLTPTLSPEAGEREKTMPESLPLSAEAGEREAAAVLPSPPLRGRGQGEGVFRPVTFPLAFAALLHDIGKRRTMGRTENRFTFHGHEHVGKRMASDICRRLKMSNDERVRIEWLVEKHQYLCDAQIMRPSRLLPILVHPGIGELLALHRADSIATGKPIAHVEFCENILRTTPPEILNPAPLITGDDLIALGIEQGPLFKKLLDAIREAQLEGTTRTKDEALEMVQSLLKENGAP